MGAYIYQAMKKSGQPCKGVIEADSDRHARQLLREQHLWPTSIAAIKSSYRATTHKDKLPAEDLSLFTRQLATLLAAGIPVEEALRGVSEQTEKDKIRRLIIGVRSKVMEGYALAQAMADYPKVFPQLFRATVSAGEQTGRLDMVLEKLADYTENQQTIRQKIKQALIYPVVMVMVSMGIISFLLSFVVPKIIDVFSNSGQTLPPMTQVLIALSAFVKAYGLYAFVVMALLIIILKRSLQYPTVRFRWDHLILKLPIVSYMVKSINVARYIHTFAILFAAGVNVLETMQVSAGLLSNVVMRQAFNQAAVRVREGASISTSLKETGFIRPMTIHLIGSGEKSGQISPMMERGAKHLDNEVRRLIDTALTLLEPLIILLMGAVVLFIVLATLLPIFSMEQLVN
ncbi:MAG: type II secretion system inner membrane protein GspF [Legionellales bacterium]|nr:type II secretion system inner membrane protein GspF [Legionellales bacterium]